MLKVIIPSGSYNFQCNSNSHIFWTCVSFWYFHKLKNLPGGGDNRGGGTWVIFSNFPGNLQLKTKTFQACTRCCGVRLVWHSRITFPGHSGCMVQWAKLIDLGKLFSLAFVSFHQCNLAPSFAIIKMMVQNEMHPTPGSIWLITSHIIRMLEQSQLSYKLNWLMMFLHFAKLM